MAKKIRKHFQSDPILIIAVSKSDLQTEVSSDEIQEKVLRQLVIFVDFQILARMKYDYS